MKIKHCIVFLWLSTLLTLGCKKNDTSSTSLTTIGFEFFIEGKGMKKMWGMESESTGLGGWGLQHLTATPDGYIRLYLPMDLEV